MTDPERLHKFREKKLIFTVATGRCGTAFFAEMLRLVPGVVSLHEPLPEYAEVLRDVQGDPQKAHSFLIDEKLPAIADLDADIYIETSHLFCKGFLEPLLGLDIVPALLWIRRDHRAVASSMFRGGTIPGRTEKGLRFYLSPEDPGVVKLAGWHELHDYQLCYWYCLEIERRALHYRALYRSNHWLWAETSLSHITSMAGMVQVLRELELPRLGLLDRLRYLNNRRRKVNPTDSEKLRVRLPSNLDELEQQVDELTGLSG